MARFKQPSFQKLYDALLRLAADPKSELYHEGRQRSGAGHRAAFWDGYNGLQLSGPQRSAHVVPGTYSHACMRAGQEWARRQAKAGAERTPKKDDRGARPRVFPAEMC